MKSSVASGIALFDAGKFFEAHEAWEAVWTRATGPQKAVLQVLILWAAALHQHQRGVETGARNLLARALERLQPVTERTLGFEPEPLRDALVDGWEQLQRGEKVRPARLEELRSEEELVGVELEHRTACPYCGEPVLVSIEPELASGASYVEDCPVCCRPWDVKVSGGDGVQVALGRADD